MPDQMRVDGDIIIGEIAVERIQQAKPRISGGVIGELERRALDMRHRHDCAAFQQTGLRPDMTA
jgi:hypothetical protein